MKKKNPKDIQELSSNPKVVYVVDAHGEGWYCDGVDEEEPTSGECVHEDTVEYDRNF